MKPKILLSFNNNRQYYIDAVNGCGGIAYGEYCPVYSDEYDGLILCGGNDIDPCYYGEDINGAINIDKERDQAESELLKAFLSAGKPVMGICRGHQFINIALGGTLYQDIENAETHTNRTDFYCVHEVKSEPGSIFERIYGTDFSVNSSHHQSVKKLGRELRATLVADNGIIEGFEHNSLPVFGVQFHPERMCFSEKREDAVDGKDLITYFVNICREYRK